MANGNGSGNSLTGSSPAGVPQVQDPSDDQAGGGGQQQPSAGSGGPLSPDPLFNQLSAAHDQAKAMFDHTSDLFDKMKPIRNALDSLIKKGDVVSNEDVVKAASKVVSSGSMTPNEMAVLLSRMPSTEGPALAQWVQQMDQTVQAQEAQLEQGHAIARHEMGVSAMRLLQYAHQAGPARLNGGPPGASPNALTGQSPGPGPGLAGMVPQGNA